MKITIKLLIGFSVIVGLIGLSFYLISLSNSEIMDEAASINTNIEVTKNDFDLFRKVKNFQDKQKDLVTEVMKLGYVTSSEDARSVKSDFENNLTFIMTESEELGIEGLYELLLSLSTNVNDIFTFKEEELYNQDFLLVLKQQKLEYQKQMEKIMENNRPAMKTENYLQNFMAKLPTLRKEYENADIDEDNFDTVKKRLIDEGLLEIPIKEYKNLWTKEILGSTLEGLDSVAALEEEYSSNPETGKDIIEKIKEKNEDIAAYINMEIRYGFITYDPVIVAMVLLTTDNIITVINDNIEFNIQMEKIQKNISTNEEMINETQDTIEQLRELSLDFINVDVTQNVININILLDQITKEKEELMSSSFDNIGKKSINSTKVIEQNSIFVYSIMGIIILTSIFVALIIILGLKKSMKNLMAKAEQIKELDLNVEFPENIKNNELGKLEETLKEIVIAFKNALTGVYSATEKINASSDRLNEISSLSMKMSSELLNEAENTEENVQNTSASIEEVSSGIEEVAASAKNVSDISNELSYKSENTETAANNGEKELEDVIDIASDAIEQTKNTSTVVEKLFEQTRNITEIVETISSIAEQTNLLALNAAIEAARAGEAGKGFAVVSDEIRKLAEESKNATLNISTMLKDISSGVKEVNTATEQNVEIVGKVDQKAREAMESFKNILVQLQEFNSNVQNLNATAEEQSASADEMTNAVDQSARAMTEASLKVRNIVEIIDKQNDSIKVTSDSSRELTELSKELENILTRFKI